MGVILWRLTNEFHLYSFSLQSVRPSPFSLSPSPSFQSRSTTKITARVNREVRAGHPTQGSMTIFLWWKLQQSKTGIKYGLSCDICYVTQFKGQDLILLNLLQNWKSKGFLLKNYSMLSTLWKWVCISLCIVSLFVTAKYWKQPNCPYSGEWLNKL